MTDTSSVVAGIIDALAAVGFTPDPMWNDSTPVSTIRDGLGDVAVLFAYAQVIAVSTASGPWPVELLEVCQTLGMLAEFAEGRP